MDYNVLKNFPIFKSIAQDDFEPMLNCLGAVFCDFEKNQVIFSAGDNIEKIGIVLSGEVQIEEEDVWGNKMIISEIPKGNTFAEAFCCAPNSIFPFRAVASKKSRIMFIEYRKIITSCGGDWEFRPILISNMIGILAQKNIILTRKMGHITKRTTRQKIMSYLSFKSKQAQSRYFEIPFNRQQLADYLSVDRSALSKELCKMRDEGIIEFNKNQFKLI